MFSGQILSNVLTQPYRSSLPVKKTSKAPLFQAKPTSLKKLVQNVPVYFKLTPAMTAEYQAEFEAAMNRMAYPGLLKKLSEKGWGIRIEPRTDNEYVVDPNGNDLVLIQKEHQAIVIRPWVRLGETLNHYAASNDFFEGLAKAFNQGVFQECPQSLKDLPQKRFQLFWVRKQLSSSPEFQFLAQSVGAAHGKMLHYFIERAIFGDDESSDPTGEKFFQSLVKSHLSGAAPKELADSNHARHDGLNYVGKLLAPFQ